jgi:hypothetical protein
MKKDKLQKLAVDLAQAEAGVAPTIAGLQYISHQIARALRKHLQKLPAASPGKDATEEHEDIQEVSENDIEDEHSDLDDAVDSAVDSEQEAELEPKPKLKLSLGKRGKKCAGISK